MSDATVIRFPVRAMVAAFDAAEAVKAAHPSNGARGVGRTGQETGVKAPLSPSNVLRLRECAGSGEAATGGHEDGVA